jgi:hypothetical protein
LVENIGFIKGQHKSGGESGDDTFPTAIRKATSTQSNSFIMGRKYLSYWKLKDSPWSSQPIAWKIMCAPVSASIAKSPHKSVGK